MGCAWPGAAAGAGALSSDVVADCAPESGEGTAGAAVKESRSGAGWPLGAVVVVVGCPAAPLERRDGDTDASVAPPLAGTVDDRAGTGWACAAVARSDRAAAVSLVQAMMMKYVQQRYVVRMWIDVQAVGVVIKVLGAVVVLFAELLSSFLECECVVTDAESTRADAGFYSYGNVERRT